MSTTFDGVNRHIIIDAGATSISVKKDIYSAWKDWVLLADNAKYPAAMRTSGGDPIGGGLYTGDIYFLINSWQILIDHSCSIDGVIYSDDFPSPFIQIPDTFIVTNKVSSLVTTVATSGATGTIPTAIEIRQEIDANSTKLQQIQTAVQAIPDNVRVELTPELTKIMAMESNGLTSNQATMLLEMYELLGLDPTKPLIVTQSSRSAGSIQQNILTNSTQTIVNRV